MANTIGYGQGAVNNTNGFGKAPTNNTIDFGEVCADSWSPETNLTGTGGSSFSNTYSTEYDGIDAHITTDATYSELDGQNKMTLSCWVKPTLNSTDEVLSCGYASGVLFQLRIYSSAVVRFQVNTTSFYTTTGAGAISANVWSHVLICIDKTQASNADRGRIFINGVEGQTNNLDTSALGTSNTSLFIGIGYGISLPYEGLIDEAAIWSGTDLRNDVATLYNSGVPNNLNNNGLTAPTSWYRFEEGSGTTISDSGSSTNNATIQNSVTFETDVPT